MKTCRVCDRSLGPRHFATPRTYTCHDCRAQQKREAHFRGYYTPAAAAARAIEKLTETHYRIQRVYRLLTQYGPQTSLGVAEVLNISRRKATDLLYELHRHGGSECIDRLRHPELRGSWLKLWRAADCWQRQDVGHPPLHDHKIIITDDDEQWMQRQRDIADARRQRIAAINAVRSRV